MSQSYQYTSYYNINPYEALFHNIPDTFKLSTEDDNGQQASLPRPSNLSQAHTTVMTSSVPLLSQTTQHSPFMYPFNPYAFPSSSWPPVQASTESSSLAAMKKPKGYISAFNFFAIRARHYLNKELKNMSNNDINKYVGALWKRMSADDKAVFNRLAEEDKIRYLREVNAYNLTHEEKIIPTINPPSGFTLGGEPPRKRRGSKGKSKRVRAIDMAPHTLPLPPPSTPTADVNHQELLECSDGLLQLSKDNHHPHDIHDNNVSNTHNTDFHHKNSRQENQEDEAELNEYDQSKRPKIMMPSLVFEA